MFNLFGRYEDAFRDWRRGGMPGVKTESYKYIEFLTSQDDDQAPKEGTLWPHQWDAFLRVVYSHEILGKAEIGADGLLLNGGMCPIFSWNTKTVGKLLLR